MSLIFPLLSWGAIQLTPSSKFIVSGVNSGDLIRLGLVLVYVLGFALVRTFKGVPACSVT